jgi:hypothetical protein
VELFEAFGLRVTLRQSDDLLLAESLAFYFSLPVSKS